MSFYALIARRTYSVAQPAVTLTIDDARQCSPKGVNWDNCTPVGDGCTVAPDTDDLTVRVGLSSREVPAIGKLPIRKHKSRLGEKAASVVAGAGFEPATFGL